MNPTTASLARALSILGALVCGNTMATTTGASASSFVSGTTISQSVAAGAEGAQASANQLIPSPIGDVFVSAEASSVPGALRAASSARTNGTPGGFQGHASASWADSFVISAPGYDSSMTGTFSGAVQVTGGLLVEYLGRVYSDSKIYATVDLFPGTGFNGGRTTVGGSARNIVGYDIVGGHTGTDSFSLIFSNVPFTFNQRIDVTLSLTVSADVNAIDAGAQGKSIADYGNTMTWSGLSNVLDQNSSQLSIYSAVSAGSAFDFARATPVPEPSRMFLLACGLVLIVMIRQGLLCSRPRTGAACHNDASPRTLNVFSRASATSAANGSFCVANYRLDSVPNVGDGHIVELGSGTIGCLVPRAVN